jgi:IrrE N-terminal-like domain
MRYLLLTSESKLESMLLHQIHDIKRQHSEWANPHALATSLGFSIVIGNLGIDREGAALTSTVVLDPSTGVRARQRFTLYHEIVHLLIKRNDELYSILHDQYSSDQDFNRIIERLCNVGAAEFIVPDDVVRAAIQESGFSILLVKDLSNIDEASPTAVAVQLALHAKHKCIMAICKMIFLPQEEGLMLLGEAAPSTSLQVSTAVSSSLTKYRIGRKSLIPKGHLLYEAYEAKEGERVRGEASVPLRSGHNWIVECEAMRIKGQVFGIFHLESVPIESRYQLPLFS